MRLAVATTTWNSADVIALWLAHYRRLGASRAYVMDFDSVDGTPDLLRSDDWKHFVELVQFPGLSSLDSSRLLLERAKCQARDEDWCLFCDPDELLVTPRMNVEDLSTSHPSRARLVPRFNVTAPLSAVDGTDDAMSAVGALILRIDRREPQAGPASIDLDRLTPPWIFTAIDGKALVHVASTVAIAPGDHGAQTVPGDPTRVETGAYFLHYPFRTFRAFQSKVEMAKKDFGANPHLPPVHGWQIRRWIRLADRGDLLREYQQQFIPDDNVEALLASGALVIDSAVRDFHRDTHAADAQRTRLSTASYRK